MVKVGVVDGNLEWQELEGRAISMHMYSKTKAEAAALIEVILLRDNAHLVNMSVFKRLCFWENCLDFREAERTAGRRPIINAVVAETVFQIAGYKSPETAPLDCRNDSFGRRGRYRRGLGRVPASPTAGLVNYRNFLTTFPLYDFSLRWQMVLVESCRARGREKGAQQVTKSCQKSPNFGKFWRRGIDSVGKL